MWGIRFCSLTYTDHRTNLDHEPVPFANSAGYHYPNIFSHEYSYPPTFRDTSSHVHIYSNTDS